MSNAIVIYEYAAPSETIIFFYWSVAVILGLIAAWLTMRMPWLMYGVIVPLWSREKENGHGNLFAGGMVGGIAIGLGIIAHSKQIEAGDPVSSDFINTLPVVEGAVEDYRTFVIPAGESGRVRWCVQSFNVAGVEFDVRPGVNRVAICSRDVPPTSVTERDYIKITHNKGQIFRLERRRQ